MGLITDSNESPVALRLNRDLVRVIKRGNAWVFRDSLRDCPAAPAGAQAILLDSKRGRVIARGFYDSDGPIAFRACDVDQPEQPLDDDWADRTLHRAWQLRRRLFLDQVQADSRTTAFRLFSGEGDGLPGLVVDLYDRTAVLKLDGVAPGGFWDVDGLGEWLASRVAVRSLVERMRDRDLEPRLRFGSHPDRAIEFFENGLRFSADVWHGQKTGFFLDQRDNRRTIQGLAHGLRVLNLFGYTGGFSVYAGVGGAAHVTTVDVAAPAIAAARLHWQWNGISDDRHSGVDTDAFEFLTAAHRRNEQWGLVISDPPSFAPSQAAVPRALSAYHRLAADGAAVTSRHGLLALASCSSHVDLPAFMKTIEEGISAARRRGTVLTINGLPPDHPTPLAMPELRYLKFVVLRVS